MRNDDVYRRSLTHYITSYINLKSDAWQELCSTTINLRYIEENDTALECGEEFKEELAQVKLTL